MMIKKTVVLIAVMFSFSLTSCKTDKKEAKTNKLETKENVKFALEEAENTIKFTAYKFTEKKGVGGEFRQVKITSGGQGETIKDAINNTEFSVPITSLFTKDSSRDYKIQKFFFGVMTNTENLTGKFSIKNDSIGAVTLKMNDISENIPFTYTIKDNTFAMKATMDVSNWNGLEALSSLNKVCEVLHTGADGVSKTWSDVALNISSTFK